MMVVTVVDLVLILNIAQNVNVLEEVLAMELLILWLEMDTAKMKPTMLSVTTMVKTAVDLLSIETNALSVFVTVCIFKRQRNCALQVIVWMLLPALFMTF